ncbi:MAG: low molecular weight phosphatase family protein [Halobacteriales archaeon]
MSSDPVRIAFVCVQNAGRSQMATAFAEREAAERDPEGVEIVTGGTAPADRIHPEVVAAMDEVGFDLGDRSPRAIKQDELDDCDLVITMGCSADDVCPAHWAGESRDWDLQDPHGLDVAEVRPIREDIQERVDRLFDELTTPDQLSGAG